MKSTPIILRLTVAALVLLGLALLPSISTAAEPAPNGPPTNRTARATFAGGCFWCMEAPFEKLPGVTEVLSGYTAGTGPNPTYEDYAAKGYLEAIQVTYDPVQVTYAQLLDFFWRQIDPTDAGGQFVDRGPQYRSAIFYQNEAQKRAAQHSKEALARSGRYAKPLVTEILPASAFYPAEEYHQGFYKKNPARYHAYRAGSGRDEYLQKIWGKDKDTSLNPTSEGSHGRGGA